MSRRESGRRDRAVEWLRGHHYVGLVNSVERAWYEHHQPAKGGTPKIPAMALGGADPESGGLGVGPSQAPPHVVTPAPLPFPGEGVWRPASTETSAGPAPGPAAKPQWLLRAALAACTELDLARNRLIDHAAGALVGECEQCFQALEAARPIVKMAHSGACRA